MNPTESPAVASCGQPAAVLDTNAVLDWLLFRDPGIDAIATAIETGALRWLATPHMRCELQRTLAYPALEKWRPDCERTLAIFDRRALICAEPMRTQHDALVCSDPDDQVFIDLALAQGALWLVTHDRALLRLARHAARHGVQVLRPRDWRSPI